jgi:preprotein translocase subunit YajC
MYLAAATKSGSGSYTFLIIIVVLFGLLYFVMIRPQRNRQRQAQQMQSQVQPGQRVRTTAGMYATVVEADDQDVVLEPAPGVQMRFLRRAVLEVLPDEDATAESSAADAAEPDLAGAGAGAGEPSATDLSADGPVTGSQNGAAANGTAPGAAADHTVTGEHPAD